MTKKIPQKMKAKGVTVDMKEVFREGPYVVLQLQVIHVDMVAVERSMQESEETSAAPSSAVDGDSSDDDASTASSASANTVAGALLQWTYTLIGAKNQARLESQFLPPKVQAKLETGMAEMLSSTFAEKKLHAEIRVMKEANQARFFYNKLKQVREEEEARKGTSLIQGVKKRIKGKPNDAVSTDDDDDDDF